MNKLSNRLHQPNKHDSFKKVGHQFEQERIKLGAKMRERERAIERQRE